MKKQSDIFFEPSNIDGIMIFGMIGGSVFFAFWGAYFLFASRVVPVLIIPAAVLFGLSLLLLAFGIYVKVHGIYTKPNRRYLMRTGLRAPTRFTAIKKMKSLSSRADPMYIGEGKWSCPFVVITTGINPVTGREMRFESDYIMVDPYGHLKEGENLDVYVDPRRADRYFMDLAPLQDRLEALLKNAVQRYEIG